MKSKIASSRAQVAIFVVIALVIVAGVAGFFLLKDKIFRTAVPSELIPVYDYYQSCVEAAIEDGASLLGTQAGYIEPPAFEPGSEYAPFSNQLEFMGFGVPYWYYVSGNAVIKEQAPSKRQMEAQLADYIEGKLGECDFTEFRRQGYGISAGEPAVDASIQDMKITASVKQKLILSKGAGTDETGEEQEGITAIISSHEFDADSNLGGLYETAREIYDYEKENMFIENYAVDVLNLYAPVTGTEISCSPLIWNPYNVIDDLKEGLAGNIGALKIKGDYYELNAGNKGYHVIDAGIDLPAGRKVNFLYSPEFASRFEIWPTKNNVMMAKPVGPSQGMAAAGFCYVSYKFVYDMFFPVLVQVYSGEDAEEIFQFPVAVVVTKNQPREAMAVDEMIAEPRETICDNAATTIDIYTYNVNLEPVEADIEFRCFTDICELGKTSTANGTSGDAELHAKVPQCVNGVITANADSYKEKKYYISTNEESVADIILDRQNKLAVKIYVDGILVDNMAVLSVSENAEDGTSNLVSSIAYPDVSEIELAEGDYTFELNVYTEKPLALPEYKQRVCVDVPKKGVLGIFGVEEEECFDYVIPAQTLSYMLYAGGNQVQYITQSELDAGTTLKVYAESAALPTNVEKIQETYNLIEVKGLRIALE